MSLSSSNSHVVGSDLDPKIHTNKTCDSVKDSCMSTHLENFSSVVNIEIPIIIKDGEDDIKHAPTDSHMISTNFDKMEDNDVSGSSVPKGKAINKAEKKIKRRVSLTSLGSTTHSAWCSKMLIFFGVCFIIGWHLIPFIVSNVTQTGGNPQTDVDYSLDKNTSSVSVYVNIYIYIYIYIYT